MVAKMLYQIQNINHDNWNVNCTVRELSKLISRYNIMKEKKYLSLAILDFDSIVIT